jgi:hsp70-interacting protein
MPNNSDTESKERRFRDLLGLVKFCLESTKSEDATGPSNFEAMDPDRRAWLQRAIESMTVDTTKQLLENLATVKETIMQMEKNPTHNVAVQRTCDAISILTDLCEEIDYAADFAKLDGFSIFKPLIKCSHEEMIVKACELIAALAQNNPLCQNMAVQTRLLEALLDFVAIKEDQSHIKARSYALYAISSIVRSNQEVRSYFESQLDGLTVLLDILSHQPLDNMLNHNKSGATRTGEENKKSSLYWWRKLRIRSVFLFRTLCSESEKASDFFYQKHAIKHISDQLNTTQDLEIREHLLHALKAFLSSLSTTKQVECIKLAPDLRSIVERIHKSSAQESGDDYDMTETRSICKELLDLIDSVHKK